MRTIDADALKELFSEVIGRIAIKPEMNGNLEHMIRASAMVIQMIDDAPTVQPERKTGHWVEIGDEPYDEWECDVCGFAIDGSGCIDPEEYRDVYKFCPNCGADMRGEQDE